MTKSALPKTPATAVVAGPPSGARTGRLISLYENGIVVKHLIGMIDSPHDIRRVIVTAARRGYDGLLADAAARYAMISPVEASPVLKAAEALAKENDPVSKEAHRAGVIAEIKSDARSYINLARRLAQSGRYSDAFDSLERAVSLDPGHAGTLPAAFFAEQRSGDHIRAASIYRAMLGHRPGDVRLTLRLARALQHGGKENEARRALERLDDARLRRFRDFDSYDVGVLYNAGHDVTARYAAQVIAVNPTSGRGAPLKHRRPAQATDGPSPILTGGRKSMLCAALAARWKDGATDWNRRAGFGLDMSGSILDLLLRDPTHGPNRRFPDDILALIDTDSMAETRARLSAFSEQGAPAVLMAAHIGPTMVAVEHALQSIPDMRYFSGQLVYGLMRGGDNFMYKAVDSRRQAIDIYNAVTSRPAFYTSADLDTCDNAPKREIALLDTVVHIPLSMPGIVFRAKARAYWYAATWRGGKIRFELEQGPCVSAFTRGDDWIDAWLAFYTGRLERALRAAPENFRPCIRYMEIPPKGRKT